MKIEEFIAVVKSMSYFSLVGYSNQCACHNLFVGYTGGDRPSHARRRSRNSQLHSEEQDLHRYVYMEPL